jgi:hypothetical protein
VSRTIEHLTPARVEDLWSDIEYLLYRVAETDIAAPNPLSPECIRIMAQHGVAHILAVFDGPKLDFILVFEFAVVGGVKTASISAVAGRGLLRFRSEFWADILAWFRASGVRAVDGYAKPNLARIYQKKFGFENVCSYTRLVL